MKFGAIYCIYDDHEYLDISLFPISDHLDKVLFLISDVPWNGKKSDNSETINKVKELCSKNKHFELIQGHWTNEIDQRNFGLFRFFVEGIDIAFVIDSDEIYPIYHFLNIKQFIIQNPQIDAFHLEWNTYWTKDYYRINPREHYKPLIAVRVSSFKFTYIRGGITSVIRTATTILKTNKEYNGVLIPPQIGICFHLSYARNNEYMKRKLETNSHASEFIKGWYENVWLKWKPDMRNLHPVTPQQYQVAIKEDFAIFPEQLKTFIKKEKLSNRTCSIIILNWDSCSFLKRCVEMIEKNTQRKFEIIIVDNGSVKDDSVEYIKDLKYKKIFNNKNLGFTKGVNQALKIIDKTSDICLLNVDAEVQENWLDELYNTMIKIGNCGIVGPLGNEIENGYQKKGMIEQDCTVPNVHGFCLLILRELFEKIGLLDDLYEIGGSEDLDYCLRAKLAGYVNCISAKSLVIHKAHQVYDSHNIDRAKQDSENHNKYLNKFFGMLQEYAKVYNLFEIEPLAKGTGLIKWE